MRLEIIKLSWSKVLYRKTNTMWHYYTRYRTINPDGSKRTTRPTITRINNEEVLKLIKEYLASNYSHKLVKVFTNMGDADVELSNLSVFLRKDSTFETLSNKELRWRYKLYRQKRDYPLGASLDNKQPFRLKLVKWFVDVSNKIKEMV